MRRSALRLWAILLLTACGESGGESGPEGDGCACPGDQCALGECVVEVQIAPGCGGAWGEASVYLGDTSAEAAPVGVAAEAAPFRTCEGYRARIDPQEAQASGVPAQEAEMIPFQVVSQDMRLVFPATATPAQCSGSQPLVLVMDCP
jgi:hypothetical protein